MTRHPENLIFSPPLDESWSFLDAAAATLGFIAVGVAPAGKIHGTAVNALKSWLENNMHASMDFMARTLPQRKNTQHPGIVKDADAVIVAAFPYGNGAIEEGIWQYIARHARGLDYHITVKVQLKRLAETVCAHFPNCHYRLFTDSAPIAERTWAAISGIGTIGKSGAVMIPQYGPKILLGEIVCKNVPVPPMVVPPAPFSVCMDCTACMDVCPTGAIVAPGVIACNRCLSYWSIERKEMPIPKQAAEALTSIFGCDMCTAVCPQAQNDSCKLNPGSLKEQTSQLSLHTLINTDESKLAMMFENSALTRPGWQNIKANAELVLRGMDREKKHV